MKSINLVNKRIPDAHFFKHHLSRLSYLLLIAALSQTSNSWATEEGSLNTQKSASKTKAKTKSKPRPSLVEILVTAQKRVETQQDIAASFNVMNEAVIEKAQWNDVSDIANFIPGLEVVGTTKTRTSIYIRGIGTNKYDIGTEGSVGVFVDGIYIPRFSSIMQNLVDIDRIEVLKGPQGTLYGRNTIGGAISIYTKLPSDDFEGSLTLEAGNEESTFAALTASGTLIKDKLLGYIGVTNRVSGGFRTELNTGAEDDENVSLLRTKLYYMPTDTLTAVLSLDQTEQTIDSFTGEPVFPPGNTDVFAISTFIPPEVVSEAIAAEAEDQYVSNANTPGMTKLETESANLSLTWSLEDIIIDSITGLRDEKAFEHFDDDRMAFDIIESRSNQESKTISQELKFTSEEGGRFTFDDKLEWLTGLYIYKDEAHREDFVDLGTESVLAPIIDLLVNIPTGVGFSFPGSPIPWPTGDDVGITAGPPYPIAFNVDLETESWAVFAEMGYYLSETFMMTLGIRSSYDTKTYTYEVATPGNELSPFFFSSNFVFTDTLKDDSVDPKIVIEWRPDSMPDLMIFSSYTQGYKSGGIQFATQLQEHAERSFKKEILKASELGIKSRWFRQRLQWNASIYHYDYADLQIQQIAEIIDASGNRRISNITDNAGKSVVNGFESEVQYVPTHNLFLQLSYNYMDSEFVNFTSVSGENFKGNKMAAAPEHSAWATVEYDFDVGEKWNMSSRIDYSWRSKQAFDSQNRFWEEAYGLINLSINLSRFDESLAFKLFCTNCGDTQFRSSVTALTTDTGWSATGERRRFGLNVKYKF